MQTVYRDGSCGRCIDEANPLIDRAKSSWVWAMRSLARCLANRPKTWSTSSCECPARRNLTDRAPTLPLLTWQAQKRRKWLFFTSRHVLSACIWTWHCPNATPCRPCNNDKAWAMVSMDASEFFCTSGFDKVKRRKCPCTRVSEICSFGLCIVEKSFPNITLLLGRATFDWSRPSCMIQMLLLSFLLDLPLSS